MSKSAMMDIRFLRKEKGEMVLARRRLVEEVTPTVLPLEMVVGGVVVAPIKRGGDYGVVNRDGKIVSSEEVAWPEGLVCQAGKCEGEEEDGLTLYCGKINFHWGHFLVDCLSRLWPLVEEGMPEFDRVVFVAPAGSDVSLPENVAEAFRLLGIEGKVEILREPKRYSRVAVSPVSVEPRGRFGVQSIGVYDKIALAAMEGMPEGGGGAKKVFMSRSHFKKGLRFEPETRRMDAIFARNGFKIVHPQEITLTALIRLLRGANVVAAMSGTLPHNMVFGYSGQKLWILEKYASVNNYQPGIDLRRGLDSVWIDCNGLIQSVDPGNGPFLVYPNSNFMRFAAEQGFEVEEYGRKVLLKMLRRYFKLYRLHYHYSWPLPEWLKPEIGLLREAYDDSLEDFGEWIGGEQPLFWRDKLSLRRLAKRLLGRG